FSSTPSSTIPSRQPSISSSSNSDDDLPYPVPLPRSDFLKPDFCPSEYLSSLHNRHQTLEDLRSELRSRSQQLNKELLDLVSSNYQDFLSLGSALKGGDGKVEEVRVGLLGFRREVEGIRTSVGTRAGEVGELLAERVKARQDIALGRNLLEVDARLGELEENLTVESGGKHSHQDEGESTSSGEEDLSDDDDDSDDGLENGGSSTSVSKLQWHVQQYLLIKQLAERIGPEHPFLVAQQPRFMRLRNTLLLDLSSALKQAKGMGTVGSARMLKVVGIYRDMDEAKEAVRMLKGLSMR
ncbi:hypothetical protein LTR04_007281, partial [Oleoguttula sp. CCFEE 6159]